MSGIAGVVNLDGSPLQLGLLERITRAASPHRGEDAVGLWMRGSAGLSQLLMATRPGAETGRTPFQEDSSGLSVVFDGRIDDREGLVRAMAGHGFARAATTDMELVLRAYQLWGADCAAHLIGDFAFAIWDERRRTLFCARDPAGVRPFYYFCDGRFIVFATEIRQLLEHPRVPREPNEGMVGEVLASAFVSPTETLYVGVSRLPAGTWLMASDASVRTHGYWSPSPRTTVRYRDDREHLEQFAEVLGEAVRCRLLSNGPVGAMLSGGLDSSTLVSLAQKACDESGEGRKIATFSITQPGHPYDEEGLVDDVVRECGVESYRYPFVDYDRNPGWAEQAAFSRDLPEYPNLTVNGKLQRRARALGIRVLLSGDGADTWLGGTSFPYWSAVVGARLRYLAAELWYQTTQRGLRRSLSDFGKSLTWPVLPVPLRRRIERSRKRHSRRAFLEKGFATRIGLDERIHRDDCAHEYRDLARWSIQSRGRSGGNAFHLEVEDRSNTRNGVEERHPFLDRRLIELASAMPDHRRHFRGERKLPIRSIARGLLPDSVLSARVQADWFRLLTEVFRLEEVTEALSALEIARLGWVNATRVAAASQEISALVKQGGEIPDGKLTHLMDLWMVYAVEVWFRSFRGGSPESLPVRNTELS